MKASFDNERPDFNPVTFHITCESEEEVRMLYTIMNAPHIQANKHKGCHGIDVTSKFGYDLWQQTVGNYFKI